MNIKTTLALAGLVAGLLTVDAQVVNVTNPVEMPAMGNALTQFMADISSGNQWAFVGLYGRSTKNFGNSQGINLVSGDVIYSFSPGTVSNIIETGVIVGYDYLWTRGGNIANAIKGGLSLGVPMRPFSWVGSTMVTNVIGEPFVGDCLASPQGGSSIGNIVLYGLDIRAYQFGGGGQYSIDTGVGGETRSGQAQFDGNYIWLHLAITRNGLPGEATTAASHKDNSEYWNRPVAK